jgi:hypothetical protein
VRLLKRLAVLSPASTSGVGSSALLPNNDYQQQDQHYDLDNDFPEGDANLEHFNNKHDQHQDEDKYFHKYFVHDLLLLPVAKRFWQAAHGLEASSTAGRGLSPEF